MEQLIKFIESAVYTMLLDRLENDLNIKVNKDIPSYTILNYDILKLKAAKVNINELEKLIETDYNKILIFTANKIKKCDNFHDKQGYAKEEELDEYDMDVRIKVLPFYKNFLLIYLIEYFFLKTNPSELASYFKAIRIPNAKKYEKELKEIYSNL
jgi:hypothetical protein